MSDPNGWVQSPPSVFVKIEGTSRDTVNGKLGLVLQYTGIRYTILLAESQQNVSLKAENLVVCGMIDKARAYYQMLSNNPDVLRQFQQVSRQLLQSTGLKFEYILAAVLVVFAFGWYFIGFSKILMVLTVVIVLATIVGPDLGKDAATIARNMPNRWRDVVRTQVPSVGPKIASNNVLLGAFTAVLIAFVVYSLAVGPKAVSSSPPKIPRELGVDLKERYYKLGFDDATNEKEFGQALVAEKSVTPPSVSEAEDDMAWRNVVPDYDLSYDEAISPKRSPFSISTAFALLTIGRTLYPMSMNVEGKFDLQLLVANAKNMEVWKVGLLGFSVYRIVSAFL